MESQKFRASKINTKKRIKLQKCLINTQFSVCYLNLSILSGNETRKGKYKLTNEASSERHCTEFCAAAPLDVITFSVCII